jgi:DNA-binding transcriptional LysR family regulator
MLPDLDSLRCFVAAADCLNFRTAAARVALSPAAFSDRIRRLEADLGAVLFERSTRRVATTPAGLRLLPHARQCLDEAGRCAQIAREADAPTPFALRVGTRYELGLSWLVPALAPLRAARPERTLHLAFGEGDDLLARLHKGEIDAVVTSARLVGAGLETAPLHAEAYVFVGARTHLRRRPLRAATDAAAHTLLDTRPDLPLFRYFRDARPADEEWRFAAVELLGTIAAVRLRVLEGAGVAVLPRYFVEDLLESRRLTALLPDTPLPQDWFRLVWRTGHPHGPHLRTLGTELAARPLG